jgi:hypothetical protein
MSTPGIRLTYEFVQKYFADQGCELLDTEYKNARTKLRYRCSCGNEACIVFDSFRQGNRCRKCGTRRAAEKQTLTQAQVEQIFRDGGCELLGEYVSSRAKMKYRCSCGQVSEISVNNFQKGHRCWDCGVKKRSSENHYEWQDDREALAARFAFRQRSYKLVQMVLKVTGRIKNKRTAALLGYDYKQLQEHITNHPNWPLVKDGRWHIDHIFPIKAFADYGITDLAVVNSLDNLRPLGYKENISKHGRYDKAEFEKYLSTKGISWKSS